MAVVDITVPDDDSRASALYSVRDKRFYYVPPIPCCRGFPSSYQCVAMNGQLYVLGGIVAFGRTQISKEVYVLDLLGERRWRQCQSMRKRRHEFGCAVMHGKIYVFGGNSRYKSVGGADVYDPTLDSWSPIPYSGIYRFEHRVTVVGEELVLHGGMNHELHEDGFIDFDSNLYELSLLEFYNPVTKECRLVDTRYFKGMDVVSGTQGIFYSIRWEDVGAHAVDEHGSHARTVLRSFSENVIVGNEEPMEDPVLVDIDEPFTVTVVDDELLAVVHWINIKKGIEGSCFVRSRGYSTENNQISWENAPCFGKHSSPVINDIKCSIQL